MLLSQERETFHLRLHIGWILHIPIHLITRTLHPSAISIAVSHPSHPTSAWNRHSGLSQASDLQQIAMQDDENEGDGIIRYDESYRTGMKGTLSCIMTNTPTANANVVHRHLTSRQVMDAFEGLSIQATKHRPQPLPNPNLHTSTPSSPFTVSLPRLVASPLRVVDISVYYLLSTISESGWDQMLSIASASAPTHIQDSPYHVCKAHIRMIKVNCSNWSKFLTLVIVQNSERNLPRPHYWTRYKQPVGHDTIVQRRD
ncbi:hypothetical protein F4604DRAFT_1935549 [Suillus subluteus]|nr:hypothetical protein F4604DRAFT_1935549 [Suillus subluteus]